MKVMPQTRLGWLAVWLLLPVLFYPLYWSVFLLLPDSLRDVSIAVVIAIVGLAFASLATACLAILWKKDRSVLLITLSSATLLLVAVFAVGEALGH